MSQAENKEQNPNNLAIVGEFVDLFPEEILGLPPQRESNLTIDLVPKTGLSTKTSYRVAPKEMEELMDKGYIRSSVSPWSALVLFLRKKDNSL